MTKAVSFDPYFTRRLLDTLTLADEAADHGEKVVHLRACRYYRDLLCVPNTRKAERIKVNLPAQISTTGLPTAESVVVDITTYGFKTAACSRLAEGTDFTLHLEGLIGLPARVVWLVNDWAGCLFLTPLHPALLEAAIGLSRPDLRHFESQA
jgi:hypothetical protein